MRQKKYWKGKRECEREKWIKVTKNMKDIGC